MSKKTITIIAVSAVLTALIITGIALLSSCGSPAADDQADESRTAETLPTSPEETASSSGTATAGTTAGSETASNTETAPDTSEPGHTISGDIVTGDDNTETVSLEVYIPTDITFESTRADGSMSYLAYLTLTSEEKEEFYYSFEDPRDFYTWFNAAYDEYYTELNPTQIGPPASDEDN